MSWFRVDDKSAFHRKVVEAGNAAWGAFCRLGAWCCDHGTDGKCYGKIVATIASESEIRSLIDVGLLEILPVSETEVGGVSYQLHQFLEWNPSAKDIAKLRKERSKAGKEGASKRWSKPMATTMASAVATPMANEWQNDASYPYPLIKINPPLIPPGGGQPGLPGLSEDEPRAEKPKRDPRTQRKTRCPAYDDDDAEDFRKRHGLKSREQDPYVETFMNICAAKGYLYVRWGLVLEDFRKRERGPSAAQQSASATQGRGRRYGAPLQLAGGEIEVARLITEKELHRKEAEDYAATGADPMEDLRRLADE